MKKLFVLTFALFSVFASCSNLDGGSSASLLGSLAGGTQNAGGANSARFVTVSGSLALTGAVPEEISAALCHAELVSASNNISKTAFPTVPAATELSCDVKAVNVDDETEYYTGTATGLSSYTVSIPAAAATKSYKIKVEASLVVESVKAGVALSGISEEFPVTQESPLVSQDVSLKPVSTSGGYGILDITINVRESGISYARATIQYSALEEETLYASPSGSGILTFKQGEMKTTGVFLGIKAGSWPVTFDFYSGDDTSSPKVYSFKETINIFNNLTTSKWVQNGGEPWFETSGSGSSKSTGCHVTAEMVSAFAVSDFYVDPSVTSSGSGIAPWSAKKTLSEALALLQNKNTDYTIYIKGELKEDGINLPTTLKTDGSGATNAKSLTLCGAQGLDTNGVPQDSVSPKTTSGKRVIEVRSYVPLTIRDLTVTGGNLTSGSGGGIMLYGDHAKLTLDSGALVKGNTAATCGGGIYSEYATVVINAGAEISGNTVTGTGSDNPGGGGVYIKTNGSLEMNGGVIKGNKILNGGLGGGVCCDTSSFTMKGGVIGEVGKSASATSADGAQSNKAARGGGVCFDGNTKDLKLSGGKIAWNYAVYGGGVYVGRGNFIFSGGTIADNGADNGGGVCLNGSSSKMYMSGTALIGAAGATSPADYDDGKHSNKAEKGGGVYCDTGSAISLGYASSSDTAGTALNPSYGIRYNYASDASGSTGAGGGVYLSSSCTMKFNSGTIANNTSNSGGGVCCYGNMFMSGSAVIGDMSVDDTTYANENLETRVISGSNEAKYGGGVYVASSGSLYMGYTDASHYDSGFTGGISYNYASYYGGGVNVSSGKMYMAYGKVKSNGSSNSDGGILLAGNLYIGGTATIPPGDSPSQNGLFLETSKYIEGISDCPLTGSDVIAKIKPSIYDTSTKVVDVDSFTSFPNVDLYQPDPAPAFTWIIFSGTGKLIKGL